MAVGLSWQQVHGRQHKFPGLTPDTAHKDVLRLLEGSPLLLACPPLSAGRAAITSAQVETWITAASASPASLAAVKQLVKAYRAACHHGDADEDLQVGAGGGLLERGTTLTGAGCSRL